MSKSRSESKYWWLYKQRFDLLSKNTDEYAKLEKEIVNKVIITLPRKEALLDVGAGRGNLTIPLCRHFKAVTIVEPNKVYLQEVIDTIQRLGVAVDGYRKLWQEAELPRKSYDLILCIHVLYYVRKMDWEAFIDKMNSHLKKAGIMIIVLISSNSGINDLYRRFLLQSHKEESCFSQEVISLLQSWHYDFETIPLESKIWCRSYNEFLDIASFLLHGGSELNRLEMFNRTILDISNIFSELEQEYCIQNQEDVIIVRHKPHLTTQGHRCVGTKQWM